MHDHLNAPTILQILTNLSDLQIIPSVGDKFPSQPPSLDEVTCLPWPGLTLAGRPGCKYPSHRTGPRRLSQSGGRDGGRGRPPPCRRPALRSIQSSRPTSGCSSPLCEAAAAAQSHWTAHQHTGLRSTTHGQTRHAVNADKRLAQPNSGRRQRGWRARQTTGSGARR